jgi:hypothetical protein
MTVNKNGMFKKVLVIFALLPLLVQAGPDEIRLALHKAATKEYPSDKVLVVFDSTRVDVEPSGLSKVYMHQLFKILNAKGALDKRVITIGYDPLSAYVEIREVNIYRKNGDVIPIDISRVLDYPAPARAIYWGAREKMIDVGRLETGDAVEVQLFRKGFTYALLQDATGDDDRYIPPMRGQFYDIVPFWSSDPVIEKVYTVNVPKDKPVQFEVYNGELRTALSFRGDRTIYSFAARNIVPLKYEASQVAWSDVATKLLLSTSPDWKAKSLWFYGVNEDYGSFECTPDIKAKTSEILKEAANEMDSISLLTHWVADEIRYSGISMGKGEGYTLHKGEMNYADRCGVCKDKAGMLITMLRAAGFKSYPAMTMAGERIDYIPSDQFNHSVTIVKKRDGTYMLLDPTWVPFNRELWSSLEQQQGYLMGVPEGADLMVTPVSAAANHLFKMNGKSKLLPDGTLEGEFTVTGEGQSEAAVRGIFSGAWRTEWEKNLEKELLRMAPQAQIIERSYTNPDEYQKQPILIKVRYRIPDYALAGKKEILFKPLLLSGLFRRAQPQLGFSTGLDERKYAFRDRCSRLVDITETIELPAGFTYINKEMPTRLLGDAAEVSTDIRQNGTLLSISQKASFSKRIYQPAEWPNFRDVVKAQNLLVDEPLVLKKN